MPSGAGELVLWDDRIARAQRLALAHPDAGAFLTFYVSLATYQASLLKKGSGVFFSSPLFRQRLDTKSILSAIPDLLNWLRLNAPPAISHQVEQLAVVDRVRWKETLENYLEGTQDDREASLETFVIQVVVQPFAEQLARSELQPGSRLGSSESRCPFCGGAPVVGVLREEGHGAKRTLVCGLCLTEHDYLRVLCPACNEQRFDALPIFTAETFRHVRVEACDTCHTYLKTIDLTKDGTAVPVVDDLASVSLDLWARDRGYQRLRPNLLRL
jgi:FdhE protein